MNAEEDIVGEAAVSGLPGEAETADLALMQEGAAPASEIPAQAMPPENGSGAVEQPAQSHETSVLGVIARAGEKEKEDPRKMLARLSELLKREEDLLGTTQYQLKEKQRLLREILDEWKELRDVQHRKAQKLNERMSAVTAELFNEIDWERWANSKRKEELCAQAEKLSEGKDGLEVSRQVKLLQAQWKTIGPSFREDEALWLRFKGSCDRAFEFCRGFFRELDEKRKVATAEKEGLCAKAEQLQESADWNAAAEELKLLQASWKELGPVVRDKQRELDLRFSRAVNAFFRRRRAHYAERDRQKEENLKTKTQLVEKAEYWAARCDWPRALDEVKKLQDDWKTSGPVPQKDAEAIWQRFREAIDKVYTAKRQEADKKFEPLRQNLKEKEDLCTALDALLAKGVEDEATRREVETLRSRWSDVGKVPGGPQKALTHRFTKALAAFEAKWREAEARRGREKQEAFERKSRLCEEFELLLGQPDRGAARARAESLRAEWKQLIASGGKDALDGRLDRAMKLLESPEHEIAAHLEGERLANLEKKERLCFQLEILAGIDSPHVSQKLRREWMAQELSAKLGRGKRRPPREEAEDLRRRWCEAGAVPENQRESLDQRFKQAWEALAS